MAPPTGNPSESADRNTQASSAASNPSGQDPSAEAPPAEAPPARVGRSGVAWDRVIRPRPDMSQMMQSYNIPYLMLDPSYFPDYLRPPGVHPADVRPLPVPPPPSLISSLWKEIPAVFRATIRRLPSITKTDPPPNARTDPEMRQKLNDYNEISKFIHEYYSGLVQLERAHFASPIRHRDSTFVPWIRVWQNLSIFPKILRDADKMLAAELRVIEKRLLDALDFLARMDERLLVAERYRKRRLPPKHPAFFLHYLFIQNGRMELLDKFVHFLAGLETARFHPTNMVDHAIFQNTLSWKPLKRHDTVYGAWSTKLHIEPHLDRKGHAGETCPICCEKVVPRLAVHYITSVCCKKIFHADCIATWCKVKRYDDGEPATHITCPMCRANLPQKVIAKALILQSRGWRLKLISLTNSTTHRDLITPGHPDFRDAMDIDIETFMEGHEREKENYLYWLPSNPQTVFSMPPQSQGDAATLDQPS